MARWSMEPKLPAGQARTDWGESEKEQQKGKFGISEWNETRLLGNRDLFCYRQCSLTPISEATGATTKTDVFQRCFRFSSQWRFWPTGPGCAERCSSCKGCGRPMGNSLGPPPQRTAGARIPGGHTLQSVQRNCSQLVVWKWFWLRSNLTDVTIHMEAAIQSDYPDRLLLTLLRHDGLATHWTARCVLPAKEEKRILRQCLCEGVEMRSYRWKSSMQWIWEVASTVKGTPSKQQLQTTHVKQRGW